MGINYHNALQRRLQNVECVRRTLGMSHGFLACLLSPLESSLVFLIRTPLGRWPLAGLRISFPDELSQFPSWWRMEVLETRSACCGCPFNLRLHAKHHDQSYGSDSIRLPRSHLQPLPLAYHRVYKGRDFTFCKQSEARPDYPDRPYCNLALDVAHSFHKPLPDELLDLATRIKLQLQVQVQAC